MIEQFKNDRIAQVLAVVVSIGAIALCAFVVYLGYQLANRNQAAIPPVPEVTPVVYSFNGQGDDVISFEAPATGRALVTTGHRGDRNFIVNIIDIDGFIVEQVANEIGEYDGEKAIHLDKGRYSVEVTADGPWMVVILLPQ